jgi:IS1 family transposase
MNRLSLEERAQILGLLVEGNSLRSITRITGKSINTVSKLLVDVGTACWMYHHETVRNLDCQRIQCDEIWAFCGMKEKNVPKENKGELGFGDVYTWTALDPDTKLMVSYLVGRRETEFALEFASDMASRLSERVQLTSDGYHVYKFAIEKAFGMEIDFAQLVKTYSATGDETHRRYSPSKFVSATKTRVSGNPDFEKISTSHVERQNLTMRMGMRRFTRLTNGFSKKIFNMECAVALHFHYYNFGRIHKTLRVTPAMEAGISDHVWSLEEIAKLAD